MSAVDDDRRYVTFEVGSPQGAAALATLAAQAGYGYAVVGRTPPSDSLTCGLPTAEAESLAAGTIAAARELRGDEIALIERLRTEPPYRFVDGAALDAAMAGRKDQDAYIAKMRIDDITRRSMKREDAWRNQEWRNLVVELDTRE